MTTKRLILSMVLTLTAVSCSGGTYTQEELDAAVAEAVEEALAEQNATTSTSTLTTSTTTTASPTTTMEVATTTTPSSTTTSAAQQLDDSDPRNVPAISGNDNPPLGVGPPDEIGYLVTAHTTTSSGHTRVFVLLRNNTNETARGVQAAVTMRDAGGQLVASGELSDVFPYRLEPGQIGFGEMFVSDVELPANAAFEFQWSTTEIPEDRDDQVDLVIPEHTLQGDQIVAIVENNTDSAVRLVQAGAVCILENGGIAWLSSSFTDADTLEPGGTSPVTVDMNGQDCPFYLVSAHGFDL